MYKNCDRQQACLLPEDLRDIIPQNDLLHTVIEVVKLLDLSPITCNYSNLGQNAYPPQVMLALLFYAYANNTFSSRKIAELVKYDVRYMYLAGRLTPDFRTIARFRQDNLKQMQSFFVYLVQLCQRLNLVGLKHFSIDGSRIKASAGKGKMRKREKVEQKLAEIEASIARILALAEQTDQQESWETDLQKTADQLQLKDLQQHRQKLIAAKAELDANPELGKINLTDPDCREQKRVGPGFNGQLVVDEKRQVIVGAEVVKDQNDTAQLLPMLEQAEANTNSEEREKEASADAGYATGKAYLELEKKPHIDAYVPPAGNDKQSNKPQPPYDKYSFTFDEETRKCVCPQGHPLKLTKTGQKNGVKFLDFKGTECENCPVKNLCTKVDFRTVRITEADHLVKKMENKIAAPHGRYVKVLRSSTVEPVIGQIKGSNGFRSFSVRGLTKVQGEWFLVCIVHNIKKIGQFRGEMPLPGARAAVARFVRSVNWAVSSIIRLISAINTQLSAKTDSIAPDNYQRTL